MAGDDQKTVVGDATFEAVVESLQRASSLLNWGTARAEINRSESSSAVVRSVRAETQAGVCRAANAKMKNEKCK